MAADEKWYFTKEQLANTPSRKCGFDADKELSSRQQAANFIQDMGQRLQVTQLCINTAIVYMHRFYMFHSFTRFHRNAMAAASLFLAAKVEEQPRKLEHVIKVAQICLHREQPPPDIKSELYMEQAQELVMNENILLQTLGFDVAIDHPHTHVVRCCTLVRASKDLAQTSYFMASNSLHLTTMCLQYKPTVVACFCIHLACKWSNWEIPQSNEGKPWFWYVDKTVTQELLEQLTEEFLAIFEKCPSRLKKKIMSLSSNQHSNLLTALNTDNQDKKRNGEGGNSAHQNSGMPHSNSTVASSSNNNVSSEELKRKMEYSQRHHPDYKKTHISSSSHHSRIENVQNMPVKSSCMFGPPTRTQPPLPLTTNITSATTTITTSSSNNNSSNSSSSSSVSGQRLPNSHKPIPPEQRPRRPEGHHSQPYKKEYSHFFPQQPPTVEVPKPTVVPTVKVERSIFSPEVPSTPEPKPEPITRIKEEKIEEPSPVIIPPPIKEEKVEVKQVPIEVKQPEPPAPTPPPPPPQQPVEEPHKEVKKKKKKHKEHKEHKEKHKEKHKHKKEKHKEPGPIVITIPKDKLTLPKEQPLKIKIPKDKIAPLPASPVKLKIPKDKLKESRKRDRSESPGSTSASKRPNGAVQVTSIDYKDTGLEKGSKVGPHTPPDNSETIQISERTSPQVQPSPPSSSIGPKSPHSSRPKQPFILNPSKAYRYNAPHHSSMPRFRPGSVPRHLGRPPFGRGRARMRFPRHHFYQTQFHPPPQAMYQPPPMAHFQYYIPVPTFPPPPPLPDEPPPELPPPPPPE